MVDHSLLDEPASLSGIPQTLAHLYSLLDNLDTVSGDTMTREISSGLRQTCEKITSLYAGRMREAPSTREELRFWSRVQVKGEHMIWLGMGGDEPRCDWTINGYRIRTTPARIAWLLLKHQDVPPGRHLRKQCDEHRCISPTCHKDASEFNRRPSMKRIRKDILPDGQGGWLHARCGTPLRNPPKPGQPPYCRVCRQEDFRLLKAAESARLAQRDTTAYVPPTPVLADQPRLTEPPDPDELATRKAAAMALFEDA